jgi:DNA gyrase subunit B
MAAATKIRKTAGTKGNPLPEKLICCNMDTPPMQRELFIVEGDSAGGTAKKARHPEYQSVILLGGKFTNIEKATVGATINNKDVRNFLIALGVNITKLLDSVESPQKYEYGKVVYLMDADADGKHIEVLTSIMIQRLLPTLFKRGMVYSCAVPLYSGILKDKYYYGNTTEEIKQACGKDIPLTRFKGLGQMSWQSLRETGFNPRTRNLQKISPIKGQSLRNLYALTGKDTSARKELMGIT